MEGWDLVDKDNGAEFICGEGEDSPGEPADRLSDPCAGGGICPRLRF